MAFDGLRASQAFWEAFDELVGTNELVIDRAEGTPHPTFPDLIYPLDYGYLEGTTAGDGSGIDVWLGRAKGTGVVGVLCTVDRWKRDTEVKILLNCSQEDIFVITQFLAVEAELPCVVIRRE